MNINPPPPRARAALVSHGITWWRHHSGLVTHERKQARVANGFLWLIIQVRAIIPSNLIHSVAFAPSFRSRNHSIRRWKWMVWKSWLLRRSAPTHCIQLRFGLALVPLKNDLDLLIPESRFQNVLREQSEHCRVLSGLGWASLGWCAGEFLSGIKRHVLCLGEGKKRKKEGILFVGLLFSPGSSPPPLPLS